MADRNGGTTLEFRREIASEMEMAPAEWPCQRKNRSHDVDMHLSYWSTYHDCYLVFVSSKTGNVLLHPSEGELLIEEAEVITCGRKIRCNWEAKYVRPVVEGDDDDALFPRKGFAIVHWHRCRAERKSSARHA